MQDKLTGRQQLSLFFIFNLLLFSLPGLSVHKKEALCLLPSYRSETVERAPELRQIENLINKYGYAFITGFAGSGKSTLANAYAQRASSNGYHIIWWVDCRKDILDQLVQLTESLSAWDKRNFIKANAVNPEVLIERIIRYASQNKKRILIILDDVKEIKDIAAIFKEKRGGYISYVITTRFDPAYAATLNIGSFSRKQSLAYLQSLLPYDLEDLNKLAEELKDYPLVISRSAAYLRHNKAISVDKYIALYRSRKKAVWEREEEFLNKFPELNNHQSIKASCELSLEELKIQKALSRSLLCLMSLLGSQNIPENMAQEFSIKLGYDDLSCKEALSELIKYNFISFSNKTHKTLGSISIHDAIQQVIFINMSKADKERCALLAAECLYDIVLKKKDSLIKFFSLHPEIVGHIFRLLDNAEPLGVNSKYLLSLRVFLLDYYLYIKRDHKRALEQIDKIKKSESILKFNEIINARYISSAGDVIALHHSSDINFDINLAQMEQYAENTQRLKNLDIYEKVRLFNSIAQAYLLRNQLSKAERYLSFSRSFMPFLIESSARIPTLYYLTWLLTEQKKFKEAIIVADNAITMLEYEPDTAIKFYVYNMKALSLLRTQNYQEALKTAEIATELCQSYFGSYRTDTLAESLSYKARALLVLKGADHARLPLVEAINIYEQFYRGQTKHLDQAYSYFLMGDVWSVKGEHAKARIEYLKAKSIIEKLSAKNEEFMEGKVLQRLAVNAHYLKEPSLFRKYRDAYIKRYGLEKGLHEIDEALGQLDFSKL